MPASDAIQPKTVAQAVYEHLREAILSGALEPGTRLSQDELAGRLGVSRMPVREALGRLQAEGMVLSETYRGATVTPLSAGEAEQIYLMRIALEPLLGRLGVAGVAPAGVAALEGAYREMTAALEIGDAGRCFEQVRLFHEALYAAAGRPLVLAQVLGLRDRAQRYIRRYLALPGRLAHSADNHRLLLDAARAGAADEVERLLRAELVATRDALLASLAAGGSGASEGD